MRGFTSGEYDQLFKTYESSKELTETQIEGIRQSHNQVLKYRVATYRCRETIEVECYPIFKDYRAEKRAAKKHLTKDAQEKVNRRNAVKRLTRTINTNFGKDDYSVTLTYEDGYLPDEKQALTDMQRYCRLLRKERRKQGLEPLKYVYVIEFSDGDGRRTRVHHHIIINGGLDRQTVKDLWENKGRVKVDELEPTKGSLEGLARYITKQSGKKYSKKWGCSRGLKKPTVTYSDHKISKRKVEKLAQDMETHGTHILTKAHEGYALDSCYIKTSEWVAGAYIHAKLYKESSPDG